MTPRSSSNTRHARKIRTFCFFTVSLLVLATWFQPWARAQAGWRVEIKEGETASSSLSINNRCAAPHNFRIQSKFENLRFSEPTESVLIEAGGSKRIPALFDAQGLRSKVYHGKVDIECLDCKEERGCSQDRDELAVELNVVKSLKPASVEKGNVTALASNPQLILNKIHVKNASDPVSGPPASTTWHPGVPITFVISVENSGGANSNISVADQLPAGFVLVNATCTASFGAVCASPLVQPPYGPFNIPTGGKVEIRITGYFTTGGPKINTATATAKDNSGNVLNVGSANSSTDQLTVSSAQSPVNISVAKAVSLSSTTFPAHLHYTITVSNTTLTGVYLGGNFRLRDYFTISPLFGVNWTISNPTCTPIGGALCPDMPASVPNNSGTIYFPYDATGAATTNDNGWLPANGSYKIEFDVDLTKVGTCGPAQVAWGNNAVLDPINSFSDSIAGDNSSAVSTSIATGVPLCDDSTLPGLQVSKIQIDPAGNTGSWNAPVTYRVTVTNPTSGTLNNIALSDSVYKYTGTPTFTATVVKGPCISAGCVSLANPTLLTNPTFPTATVTADFTPVTLWTGTLPSLAPSQSVVVEYTVKYVPTCETSELKDVIVNRIAGGSSWADATTNISPEAEACGVTLDKKKVTPGPIVFEQPTTYEVVFSNTSSSSLGLTVRDALSISSSQYGNLSFNYSTSCTATSGTVTPVPAAQINQAGTVTYNAAPWHGVKLINSHLTFGPMSTLTCQVTVTVHKPSDSAPFCQGDGNPQLINATYIDAATNYNPSAKPTLYDFEAADLPLCRSVIVSKIAAQHSYGPGATVTYTITVENKGKNAVGSLVLKDNVPPSLLPATVSACSPANACTAGPTINSAGQVNVSYGLLAPNAQVSFTLTATAPQAGGSIGNLAVGSFLPGGNFYFQGDETNFLQQEENIQVLTPTLEKRFDPVQIAPNGVSTLTFNIANTNSDPKQTGISFSDTLPAGLQITGVIANNCGGNVTTSNNTVTLTGGQLVGPNADGSGKQSCQISVKVKASDKCDVFQNNKANFSQVTNLDVSNIDEHLDVVGCEPKKKPTLSKAYERENIGPGGSTALTFTVTNSSGDPKQTGISFSDTLPPGLQIVGVVSSGCGGQVTISPDGQTVTLIGGQLLGPNPDGSGQHSCKIVVTVKASDRCAVYANNVRNFSDVKNLDISGIHSQLEVSGCGDGAGLIVQKDVKGAPPGFKGQFNFLVQCATPNGFYQKAVTVDWPTPGFTTLTGIPPGSQCTVTEGPPPGSLPANYNWSGLPAYSPKGGVVTIDPRGGGHVTVTDTMDLCNESGEVTITKILKGLPKDYSGVFEGTLQCWISDSFVSYPVTLTSPNGLSATIGNIPLGSTCTFQETGQPPLTGDLQWNQPVYSPKFGTVTLTGECCQQITVTNEARRCCTPSKDSGPITGGQPAAIESPVNSTQPNRAPAIRGQQRRQ